ncbi:MAG: metallophosphoesterase family protein [Smithellaceae bacterium]|nr:metallophosphoesterase family protein [Smithellaceae bacterium]
MRIGVLSDTHLSGRDPRLEAIIDKYFQDVDLIMHAGDLIHPAVMESLNVKEYKAVYGNMDPPALRELLPDKLIHEVNGFRIGLIHGWGAPEGLEERIGGQFFDVDCIVYGHSHRGLCEMKNGALFFNPGSATDRRFARAHTVGVLEITDRITCRLIEVN